MYRCALPKGPGTDLFEELAEQPAPKPATSSGAPRVQEPRRDEPCWQVVDLDALIALDHPARLVWSFVTSLELSELYAAIKASGPPCACTL